jgi:DNA-binding MarR family transcriptional regulator
MGTTAASKSATAKGSAALATDVWKLISDLFIANKPKFMAICREFALFPPQVQVLSTLSEPKPMREVARYLACDNSNLTGIIDRLEERELVRRTADEKDRRVKLLVLTEEGERLREEIVARMSVPPAQIAALPAADLRKLRDVLGRIPES